MAKDQGYEELRELGNMFVAQPESRELAAALRHAHENGAGPDELLAILREHSSALGGGGEAVLEQIPEALRMALPAEAQEAVRTVVDASYGLALAQGEESGDAPALLESLIEQCGVVVHEREVDGEVVKIVQSTIFPFINPEKQIARLIETCYQVYPPEVFARPRNALRDSEWFRRHTEGATCREIALSDERSGVSPEARVNPDEYGDEIARGEARVVKAIERFRERWTKKSESVSDDSD